MVFFLLTLFSLGSPGKSVAVEAIYIKTTKAAMEALIWNNCSYDWSIRDHGWKSISADRTTKNNNYSPFYSHITNYFNSTSFKVQVLQILDVAKFWSTLISHSKITELEDSHWFSLIFHIFNNSWGQNFPNYHWKNLHRYSILPILHNLTSFI